jgi:hypothetical protein
MTNQRIKNQETLIRYSHINIKRSVDGINQQQNLQFSFPTRQPGGYNNLSSTPTVLSTTTSSYFPQSTLLRFPLNSIILSSRQRQGIVRSFTTSKNNNGSNEETNNNNNKPEQSETSSSSSSSSKNDNNTGQQQQQQHQHGQMPIQEFMDSTVSSVRPIVDSTIKKAKDTLNTGDLLSVYSIVFLIFLIITAPYVARYETFLFVCFLGVLNID